MISSLYILLQLLLSYNYENIIVSSLLLSSSSRSLSSLTKSSSLLLTSSSFRNRIFSLNALKFDPQYFINIEAMKPLGISLVENEEGGNLGNLK